MAAQNDDVALIHRWFRALQVCVRTVDFAGSRPLFAEDMITFGTLTPFTVGLVRRIAVSISGLLEHRILNRTYIRRL
jgi:hypothetical protein